MSHKKFFAIILLITPVLVFSQNSMYNLPPKSFYNNGTITLKDYKKYNCKSIVIKTDSILFRNTYTYTNQSLSFNDIDYLRVQDGNQALLWSGYGALLMGLTAIISVLEYPYYSNSGVFIVGFTLSGAALGGLIGLAIPKWKTYYLSY